MLQRLPDLRVAADDELPLRPANFGQGLQKMPVVFMLVRAANQRRGCARSHCEISAGISQ